MTSAPRSHEQHCAKWTGSDRPRSPRPALPRADPGASQHLRRFVQTWVPRNHLTQARHAAERKRTNVPAMGVCSIDRQDSRSFREEIAGACSRTSWTRSTIHQMRNPPPEPLARHPCPGAQQITDASRSPLPPPPGATAACTVPGVGRRPRLTMTTHDVVVAWRSCPVPLRLVRWFRAWWVEGMGRRRRSLPPAARRCPWSRSTANEFTLRPVRLNSISHARRESPPFGGAVGSAGMDRPAPFTAGWPLWPYTSGARQSGRGAARRRLDPRVHVGLFQRL